MASGDQMPKIDFNKEVKGLSESQKNYMKIIEGQNVERAAKIMRMRRNNTLLGGFLGLAVLSIYGYSIFSVKQEKFLDSLDE